jgi:hypothetical protein
MAIVLRLTNASGTSDTIILQPGQSFTVPDGVSVELVSIEGVSGVDVVAGDLVFASPDGPIRISGLDADFLATTASLSSLSGVDGPVPDGFLRLLGWSDQQNSGGTGSEIELPGRFSTFGNAGSSTLPDTSTSSNDPAPASEADATVEDAGLPPATPAFTSFSTDTGLAGDSITADNQPTLRGTADAGVTVTVFSGGVALGSVAADGSGAWALTLATPLADGPHSFTAQATDASGLTSAISAPVGLTVDTTAPAAPVITGVMDDTGVAGDNITSDSVLVISGTGEDGSTITVLDGTVILGTTVVTSGTWSFTTAALADGLHSFTATSNDAAGNESAASGAQDVIIDTTAPDAPLIVAISDDTGASAFDRVTSDNTLTITGTAAAGETVEVLLSGVAIANVIADGAGVWTTTTAPLADGTHTFTARTTDIAGNQGPASAGVTVTVDTAAPSAPTIAAFVDDTGIAGDGITSDSTLVLTGTGEDGATITVRDGAAVLGTATVAGGAWTFTTPALAEGAHSFTATATDLAGNEGTASTVLAVTVDLTAPAAPVITGFSDDTGSSNSDRITSDNTLTFTGTAGAGETINIYFGASVVATATADSTGAWSATTGAMTDGGKTFTARATDAAGNESPVSNAITILVDTVAPDAPVITGFSDDHGVPGDDLTSDPTITLTGTANNGTQVSVFDGTTLLGTAQVIGGAWSFTSAALADGPHSFTAEATDVAGNTGQRSLATVVTIDTSVPATPVIAAVSDDTGVSANDRQTSDNTLTFTGTAGAGETVNIYLAGSIVATGVADGTGAWTATTGVITDGFHNFNARAVSVAGAQSGFSSNFTVIVDTAAPAAPVITSFSDDRGVLGDGVTSDNTLRLSGTAAGAHSVVIMDGATVLGTAFVFGGNWTFDTGVLADGAHSFTAVARDYVSNESAASVASIITIDTSVPGMPAITSVSDDTGVSTTDRQTSDNTLTFTGTAGAGETVNVYLAGSIVATGVADGTGAWSATTSVIADGFHNFNARAVSVAGAQSGFSSNFTVIVDTAAPAVPVITGFSDDRGVVGDGITSDATLRLSGSAIGAHSVVIMDGTTVLGTAFVFGGNWTFDTGVLADGTHSFTAVARDSVGNESSASAPTLVTIDTAQPAAPAITGFSDDTGFSSSDRQTSDNTLTFAGTAGAGETVNVYLGGSVVATGVADGTGAWTATTGVIADGYHSFNARAASASGVLSASSSTFVIIVDTAAPAAPAITGFSDDTGALGDGITSDNTLTVTGTAAAGTRTVTILDGSTVLGTAQVSGGTWTFTTAVLADGAHSFTVTGEDSAGNTSAASAPTVVTIDTAQPAAPVITGFSDDTGFSGADRQTSDNTLTFAGTAGAGETVNVYLGGSVVATGVADGTGAWTATTGVIADGYHSFNARAASASGVQSAPSSTFVIIVDTAAPAAPTITGFSEDRGTLGDGITSDNTLTLTGTAAAGTRTVTVLDGSAMLGTAQVSGGTWTFTTTALADGTHSFTVTGEDSAGNTSAASAPTVVTIDTALPAAPVITGFSDDTGFSSSDRQTSDNTLTFTGTAGAGETVNVYLGASIVATGVAEGTGAWTATTGVIADGYHSFSARAVSAGGTQSAPSSTFVIIVDTAAPAAPAITGFSEDRGTLGDGITSDNTLTLTGTAAAGTRTVTVLDGSTVLGTAQVSGGTWAFTTTALTDGAHSFTVTGEDSAGNTSAASAPTVVTINTALPAAPVITGFSDDTGFSGADRQTSDNTLTFTGTAGAGETVNVLLGGSVVATGIADGTGAWTATTGVIADGYHSFSARAVSASGVQSAPSSTFVIIVDTAAPAAPAITGFSDDTGASGDGITSDNTLTLTGTAEAGTRTVTILDGSTVLGTAQVSGGTWTFTTTALADGAHSFTVAGEDSAGNISTASTPTVVTVNTVALAAPVISGFSDNTGSGSDNITSDNTITFFGTADANVSVDVLSGNQLLGTTTANGSGNWSFTTAPLADGVYFDIGAIARDGSGNTSARSAAASVVVDTALDGSAISITGISDDTGTPGDFVTSDTTLTISGLVAGHTGLDLLTVELFNDGVSVGTTQADGAGNWSLQLAAPLAGGNHSFTATVRDEAGNSISTAMTRVVTVEVPPAAPVITGMSNDSGTLGDGTTNVANQEIFGTAEPGVTVRLFEGHSSALGSVVGETTADGSGNWTIAVTLVDITSRFIAVAVDGSGNVSEDSWHLFIYYDTSPPSDVNIIGFSDDTGASGDGITADTTITLLIDKGPGTFPPIVNVYDGTTFLGQAVSGGGADYSFTTDALADGTYNFNVTSVDHAGNENPSGNFTITVDTSGSDTYTVTDPQITSLIGGAGIDTLDFAAIGSPTPVLDFSAIDNAAVTGIEQISLADPNAQALNLTAADVLAMSDDVVNVGGTNVTRLTVFGDASDSVTTADTGWSDDGTAVDGGVTFDVFSNGTAQLYVEADIGATVAAGAVA